MVSALIVMLSNELTTVIMFLAIYVYHSIDYTISDERSRSSMLVLRVLIRHPSKGNLGMYHASSILSPIIIVSTIGDSIPTMYIQI